MPCIIKYYNTHYLVTMKVRKKKEMTIYYHYMHSLAICFLYLECKEKFIMIKLFNGKNRLHHRFLYKYDKQLTMLGNLCSCNHHKT